MIINTSKILDETERGHLLNETVATLIKGTKSPQDAIAQVRDSLSKARATFAEHSRRAVGAVKWGTHTDNLILLVDDDPAKLTTR